MTVTNYRAMLDKLIKPDTFVVNLSVDVSSTALMELCRERDAYYIDTVVEPWKNGYDDPTLSTEQRSNYMQREEAQALREFAEYCMRGWVGKHAGTLKMILAKVPR
jgi:homospermidine synthase